MRTERCFFLTRSQWDFLLPCRPGLAHESRPALFARLRGSPSPVRFGCRIRPQADGSHRSRRSEICANWLLDPLIRQNDLSTQALWIPKSNSSPHLKQSKLFKQGIIIKTPPPPGTPAGGSFSVVRTDFIRSSHHSCAMCGEIGSKTRYDSLLKRKKHRT